MPWSDITPMSQRQEFIELYHERRHTVAELCCVFGISEKTAYKWLARFRVQGISGLPIDLMRRGLLRISSRPM